VQLYIFYWSLNTTGMSRLTIAVIVSTVHKHTREPVTQYSAIYSSYITQTNLHSLWSCSTCFFLAHLYQFKHKCRSYLQASRKITVCLPFGQQKDRCAVVIPANVFRTKIQISLLKFWRCLTQYRNNVMWYKISSTIWSLIQLYISYFFKTKRHSLSPLKVIGFISRQLRLPALVFCVTEQIAMDMTFSCMIVLTPIILINT
jgi:hypothetical protein